MKLSKLEETINQYHKLRMAICALESGGCLAVARWSTSDYRLERVVQDKSINGTMLEAMQSRFVELTKKLEDLGVEP